MRTGKFEFCGKTYLLVFSARVNTALEAEGISMSELEKGGMPVTNLMRLLYHMIDAGARYAKLSGIENPGTVSYDDLLDGMDLADMEKIPQMLAQVVSGERKVEAEPPKNADAPS